MMEFVKLRLKSVVVLILIILIFSTYEYKVSADQSSDNTCYKVSNQVMPWVPKGLEIDSQGNIYINLAGGINVYNSSGVFKYGIKVKTYGDYQIKIDDNDMLNVALVREGMIRVYNKEGYIVQEKDDKDKAAYIEFKKNSKSKTDLNGNHYKLSNMFGYTKVIKTTPDGLDNTIYKIPLLAWILKLLVPIFMIIFFMIVLIVFSVFKKHSKTV